MIRELPVLSRCRRRENRFIASITIAAVCFFIGPFTVKRRHFAFRCVETVSLFRPFSAVIEPRPWGRKRLKIFRPNGISRLDILPIRVLGNR